jgi:hypothetical protein
MRIVNIQISGLGSLNGQQHQQINYITRKETAKAMSLLLLVRV